MLLAKDIDDLVRQKLDDEDDENPIFPQVNRYRSINIALRKVAAVVDEADEGHRVEHVDLRTVADQIAYPFPKKLEKVKQVVNLDTDGTEKAPPRTYVPWAHRHRFQNTSLLRSLQAQDVVLGGSYYTYSGNDLWLLPTPTESASVVDVRLYFLPAMPRIAKGDTAGEIPLPEFCLNLVAALAALELRGPKGEDIADLAADVAFEMSVVRSRVAPRTDDGPKLLIDGRGANSFASGW